VKVLGIDPGTAACGFGIVHAKGGRLRAVEYGWWETSPRDAPAARLKRIHDEVADLIARHEPEAVALEESYVGADARIALVACAGAGVDCAEYPPATVKQAVCGYGRAEKDQMQRMVRSVLGLTEIPKPHHAADALAVAICHALAPPLMAAAGGRR
jgi:crossover junction endodeoxyribonuclease RuvC